MDRKIKKIKKVKMLKNHLSKLLGVHKMSQSQLAKLTGIRKNTISDYYGEVATGMSFDHILAICHHLNCGVGDLLEIVTYDEDAAPDEPEVEVELKLRGPKSK